MQFTSTYTWVGYAKFYGNNGHKTWGIDARE